MNIFKNNEHGINDICIGIGIVFGLLVYSYFVNDSPPVYMWGVAILPALFGFVFIYNLLKFTLMLGENTNKDKTYTHYVCKYKGECSSEGLQCLHLKSSKPNHYTRGKTGKGK